MDKKAEKEVHESFTKDQEKESPASPAIYPKQEVTTLKLIFRLIYLLVYLVLGLILAPIIAYVILAISLPHFWKSSVKTHKKGKKPIKFNPPEPTKEELEFKEAQKKQEEEIAATIKAPDVAVFVGREGNT